MKNILLFAVVSAALVIFGCTEKPKTPEKSPVKAADPHAGHNHAPGEGHDDHDGHDHGEAKHEHEKDGWCLTHEVSEDECALCNKKIADQCKKDGDWCDKHQTAKSQCFKCDPKLKEGFIAKYEAKHNHKPPTE